MRVLVTGGEGQLGRELARQLGAGATVLGRRALDVTRRQAVLDAVARHRPDAVVNAAAYTAVDRAETDREACRAVNALAVGHLAEACEARGARLVQVSTDYVFGEPGDGRTPWTEADPTAPRGVYARTKLEGEERAGECSRHYVVRSCGLYDAPGDPTSTNFVETMLRLGRERDELRVVDDQICAPTYVPHLTRAIRFLLTTSEFGTYHVVNGGATSWCGFAREIFRLAGVDVRLEPISSAEFGAVAPRPPFSVLDTAKYHALGGPAMPSWHEALGERMASSTG